MRIYRFIIFILLAASLVILTRECIINIKSKMHTKDERALILACEEAWSASNYNPGREEISLWFETIKLYSNNKNLLHYCGSIDLESLGDPTVIHGDRVGFGLVGMSISTAFDICERNGVPAPDNMEAALYNPHFAIKLMVLHQEYLYNKYGNWRDALSAYNIGEKKVQINKKKGIMYKLYYKQYHKRCQKLINLIDKQKGER